MPIPLGFCRSLCERGSSGLGCEQVRRRLAQIPERDVVILSDPERIHHRAESVGVLWRLVRAASEGLGLQADT